MEDKDSKKIISSGTFKEIDKTNIETGSLEINQVSGHLQGNLIAATKKYVMMPKRRGRPRKNKLETKQSPIKKTIDNVKIDHESGLRRDRFRPIRPKPVSSAALVSKSKLLEMSSTLNIPTLLSNRFIFTTSLLDKNKSQHVSSLDNGAKKKNHRMDDNGVESVAPIVRERNVCETRTDKNSNTITINNSLSNVRSTTNSQKDSVELFFESMAQTVLNLPTEVQADIKMQICKIITNAEMKYCGSKI